MLLIFLLQFYKMPKKMAIQSSLAMSLRKQARELNTFGLGDAFLPLSVKERKRLLGEMLSGLPLEVAAGTSSSLKKEIPVSDIEEDPISLCFGFPSSSKGSPLGCSVFLTPSRINVAHG